MCVFTNDKDIPAGVRLSTRTLQYLVIPLLSIAILSVGVHHLADCPAQPLLPVWHITAGASGLLVPILYLLFDDLSPALAKRFPALSEFFDNVIVVVIPVYVLFELSWLVTGSVWVAAIGAADKCDKTIYVFSTVVIINFWVHVLTPLLFMLSLCCARLFPFLGYCTYWNLLKNAVDLWTLKTRMALSCLIAIPLGTAMVAVGASTIHSCHDISLTHGGSDYEDDNVEGSALIPDDITDVNNINNDERLHRLELLHIPVWLLVSGVLLLLLPPLYLLYDTYCKPDTVSPGVRSACRAVVVSYLLAALVWAVIGFLWIFGTQNQAPCNQDSHTYKFAFASLLCLNMLMDAWICVKICVVLYWALLSDD